MDEQLTFGQWLRRSRKARDLTQSELGKQVSCALGTVRKLEADELRPSKELAARLASYFGVPEGERAAFVAFARGQADTPNALVPTSLRGGSATPALTDKDSYASLSTTHSTNLPVLREPLIGRIRERAALKELLQRADVGLVTLTGPGGIGKTRLAQQVAAELLDAYLDGVWFVALAPISDPDLVVSTIAQALAIQDVGGAPLMQHLTNYLRAKQLLLVLDNFEQVVTTATLVGKLLATAPGLKVLVTSREVLRLSGEHVFAVPPLGLPPQSAYSTPIHEPFATIEEAELAGLRSVARQHEQMSAGDLTHYDAVRLFIERAQAAKPDFQITSATVGAVAEICQRLDGLPLAIELAAARIKLFPPHALLARLEHRLTLLTGGARDLPPRHQTIRGAIDWSYHLLDPGEQILFVQLGVFVGGWTLEAVEAVCRADDDASIDAIVGIASLLDKSLLRQEAEIGGDARFTMLETIREFALEQLAASGALESTRRRHAAYYLALAESAEPELLGPRQKLWLGRLEAEHDNLRAALTWSLMDEQPTGQEDRAIDADGAGSISRAETGLRLAGALWRFWFRRGYLSEGMSWLKRALARTGSTPTVARARALIGAGILTRYTGNYSKAQALLDDSLAIGHALGDKRIILAALDGSASLAHMQHDRERYAALVEEELALARELDDITSVADALSTLAWYVSLGGHNSRAEKFAAEVLDVRRKQGDISGTGWALNMMGWFAHHQGHFTRAVEYFTESLAIFRELDEQNNVANLLGALGWTISYQGDQIQATALLEESLAMRQKQGNREWCAYGLHDLGFAALRQQDYRRAAARFGESMALYQELGSTLGIAFCLKGFAELATVQRQPERAARLYGAHQALGEALRLVFFSSADQSTYDRMVADVRAQLGDAAFDAAWTTGRAMTAEQAIAYALEGGDMG